MGKILPLLLIYTYGLCCLICDQDSGRHVLILTSTVIRAVQCSAVQCGRCCLPNSTRKSQKRRFLKTFESSTKLLVKKDFKEVGFGTRSFIYLFHQVSNTEDLIWV